MDTLATVFYSLTNSFGYTEKERLVFSYALFVTMLEAMKTEECTEAVGKMKVIAKEIGLMNG